MAKKIKTQNSKLTKKVTREQITRTLENALGDLQSALGKKKFDRRVKKAVKMLSAGIPKAPKVPKAKSLKVKNIILPGADQKSMISKDSNGSVEPSLLGKR